MRSFGSPSVLASFGQVISDHISPALPYDFPLHPTRKRFFLFLVNSEIYLISRALEAKNKQSKKGRKSVSHFIRKVTEARAHRLYV